VYSYAPLIIRFPLIFSLIIFLPNLQLTIFFSSNQQQKAIVEEQPAACTFALNAPVGFQMSVGQPPPHFMNGAVPQFPSTSASQIK
jgi:hypothetical protein